MKMLMTRAGKNGFHQFQDKAISVKLDLRLSQNNERKTFNLVFTIFTIFSKNL